MFIWDYIVTFRMEVDLVWKSKWNFIKGLYLFQRYLPFIDTIVVILYRQSDVPPLSLHVHFFLGETGKNLMENTCRKLFYANEGS